MIGNFSQLVSSIKTTELLDKYFPKISFVKSFSKEFKYQSLMRSESEFFPEPLEEIENQKLIEYLMALFLELGLSSKRKVYSFLNLLLADCSLFDLYLNVLFPKCSFYFLGLKNAEFSCELLKG